MKVNYSVQKEVSRQLESRYGRPTEIFHTKREYLEKKPFCTTPKDGALSMLSYGANHVELNIEPDLRTVCHIVCRPHDLQVILGLYTVSSITRRTVALSLSCTIADPDQSPTHVDILPLNINM